MSTRAHSKWRTCWMLSLLLVAGAWGPAAQRRSVARAAIRDDGLHGAQADRRRVIGYFPLWLRNGGYAETDIDFSVVNVVAHFSLVPLPDGSIAIPDWGPFPDLTLIERAHAAGARVVLVVGGDHTGATAGFSGLVATAATRRAFVDNLLAYVLFYAYDGVDLDWEFPQSSANREGLTALVSALREALGPERTLSLSVPASAWYGRWFDLPALLPSVDWLGAMTYGLTGGSRSPHANNNAALYAAYPGEASVAAAVSYYLQQGVPPEKLLIGLPFFGQRYDTASDLHQPLPNNTGAAVPYRDVLNFITAGWALQRDTSAGVPYLRRPDGPGVISFDDTISIAAKCRYAIENGLGGAIIWHLGQDGSGADQPLLESARACR